MNEKTRIVAMIVAAALVGLGLWLWFSPYQSCVRDAEAGGSDSYAAATLCREAH